MNRRALSSALAAALISAFFSDPVLAQGARETIYVYAYQEGVAPNDHTKHTLFIVGDGDKGASRYTAASFSNGRRYSLASSGSGTYSIEGEAITIKAGKLEGTGVFKRGEYIEIGTHKFIYATKLGGS